MNRKMLVAVLGIVIPLIIASCSGEGTRTVTPQITQSAAVQDASAQVPVLWGVWDVYLDLVAGAAEAMPVRGATFTCNVTKFVDSPPSNLLLGDLGIVNGSGYTDITLPVGLRHPFPGLNQYTGFDVLGVFMGNGSAFGPGSLKVPGPNDQQLLNADGYTQWFNAYEKDGFENDSDLFGYWPGKSGSPGYKPTAQLSPYRYHADGLGKDGDAFEYLQSNVSKRGCFTPGSVNYRTYAIRFPDSIGVKFQYAVIAHWVEGTAPFGLDDFPPQANSDEAVVCTIATDESTLYYQDPTDFGGNAVLDITPWDWSADCVNPGEYVIKCYSTAWTGPFEVDMNSVDQGEDYCTFRAEIPAETLTSNADLPVWVEVSYPGMDYKNDFGVPNSVDGTLTSYFLTEIQLIPGPSYSITVLSPNGGEAWTTGAPYEIEWNSQGVTGNVNIWLSKDGGLSYPDDIELDTANDGSFFWVPFHSDQSDTARVKITSIANSDIEDESDDNFTISICSTDAGWVDTFGGPSNEDWGHSLAIDSSGCSYLSGSFWDTVDFDPGAGIQIRTSLGSRDSFLAKYAQDGSLIWVQTWGSFNSDEAWGVTCSNDGFVWVTGRYEGPCDFDPGGGTDFHTPLNGYDCYVSKFSSSGLHEWVRTWGAGDDQAYDINVDGNNNSYISGMFSGTGDFNPGPGNDTKSAQAYDAYLVKYDPAGNYLWGRHYGGSLTESCYAQYVTAEGDAFVGGRFQGTTDLKPGGGDEHIASGFEDNFLSAFSTNGEFQWGLAWGGDTDISSREGVDEIIVTDNAEVYVAGKFSGMNVDLNPGPDTDFHDSHGFEDVFLSRFSINGDFIWAQTWGAGYEDVSGGLACDSNGSIYISSTFRDTVDFNPGSEAWERTSNGQTDVSLSKFHEDGSFLWASVWGDDLSDIAGSLVTSGCFIFASGFYQGTVDFAPDDTDCNEAPELRTSNNGSTDYFLARYLTDGCW